MQLHKEHALLFSTDSMILYVEDTKEIWENVVAYLEAEWFSVSRYTTGEAALEALEKKWFDIALLDVMLPWIDGFDLCERIRAKKQIPIIMTTAKGTIDDKSSWFGNGADDYLVKPFALEELVMRIKAHLKRAQWWDYIHLGDIELYIDENRCLKNWEEITLPLKEWQVLLSIVEWWWMTVSRASICEEVWWWESLFENDAKLDVYIANVRKKLGKELIVTVKGVGYKLQKV